MTSPEDKPDAALWHALADGLDDDLLDPAMPEAEVARELEALGLDPAALAAEGEAFTKRLDREGRLRWQEEARQKQERMQRLVEGVPPVELVSREALLARLAELRAAHPTVGTAIVAAARKRPPEASGLADLRALVEDMEALRAIEQGQADEDRVVSDQGEGSD